MRRVNRLTLWLLLSTSTLCGCETAAGRYFTARRLDLIQTIPASSKLALGLSVSGRASPFLQTGVGMHYGQSCGTRSYGRRGAWIDVGQHLLLTSYQRDETYDWAVRRGNTLLFIPLMWDGSTWVWSDLPPRYSWGDVEVDVVIGIVGLGFSFGQFFDFLAGIVGFDPLDDDPEPEIEDAPLKEPESDTSAAKSNPTGVS